MKVLGLDQSSNMGWGVGTPDAPPVFGLIHIPTDRGDTFMVQTARNVTTRLFDEHEPDAIYFEELIIPKNSYNIRSRIVMFMITAIIELVAADAGIPTYSVSSDKWRRRLLGVAQAPRHIRKSEERRAWLKDRAIAECAKRGWYTSDDNVAEALGIMDYGLCCESRSYASRTDPLMRRAEIASSRRAD